MSLDQLAKEVFEILGEEQIPAEIIGGYALAHYGYVRNTTDIDVVVKEHQRALDVLKSRGFVEGEKWFKLVNPKDSSLGVDVLPAGRRMSGNVINNPSPTQVSGQPVFTSLYNLVESKVGVMASNNSERIVKAKSEADVGYMIQKNNLPLDYLDSSSDENVVFVYRELWEAMEKDKKDITKKGEWVDPFEEFLK